MSAHSMNTRALNDLTKDQLINLVLKQNQKIKKLFQKNNIIQPPMEFSDDYKPIPKPRKK